MDAGPFPAERHAALDLSKAAGFALGPLMVDPPSRRIASGERSEMLEPRVMRVLVALGGAPGRVISRDDLVEQCWDGVIVGNNAIDRVIHRLRHALEVLSGSAVWLETIPRVGFRLVCEQPAVEAVSITGLKPEAAVAGIESPPGARKLTRRAVAGGVVAIGVVASFGYAAWRQPALHVPDPRALELYERGMLMRRSAASENVMPALSYFKQAVAIDPEFADAWGAIAVFYASASTMPAYRRDEKVPASEQQARSAALRALALDPDQGEALLAEIWLEPSGRWLDHERRMRSILRGQPDIPMVNGALGMLLVNVGRYEDAIVVYQHMLKVESSLPLGFALLAYAQHGAGRLLEADVTLDEGFSRFPGHFVLWLARFSVLIGSKRYREAAVFARNSGGLPVTLQPQYQASLIGVADALATGIGRDRQLTIMRESIAANIEDLRGAIPMLAELATAPLLFDALEAFYLGGLFNGQRIPPPSPYAGRVTELLFLPGVLAHRDNPRHAALLTRLGLEDYWRESGKLPDYRRS